MVVNGLSVVIGWVQCKSDHVTLELNRGSVNKKETKQNKTNCAYKHSCLVVILHRLMVQFMLEELNTELALPEAFD